MNTYALLSVTLLSAALGDATKSRAPAHVHGMTISCQTWGFEWGTDEMVQAMMQLRELGVNWVSIHPYASIRSDGGVSMRSSAYEKATWLTRPIKEAHKLGLKIMIKPHIAYWGSPFSWRGEIAFSNDDQWQRFFDSYEQWIVYVAKLCREADLFVVGTELDRTIEHTDRWRNIVAAVRTHIDMPMTYAANWTDYKRVEFWDDLDAIGVQAYFPLVTHDHLPSGDELKNAWSSWSGELAEFSKRHDRPVLFTELGYNLSANAAREPWSTHQGGPRALDVQRLCMNAALERIEEDDHIRGAFLWKWFAGAAPGENFMMSTPAMRQLIRHHWKTTKP